MLLTPPAIAVAVVEEKVEAVAKNLEDVGDSTDKTVEAPNRGRRWLGRSCWWERRKGSKPPAEVRQLASAIRVATRAIGGATARRLYAADGQDGGTLPVLAPRPWVDEVYAMDGNTLLMFISDRKKKL